MSLLLVLSVLLVPVIGQVPPHRPSPAAVNRPAASERSAVFERPVVFRPAGFGWPLEAAVVTRRFDPPPRPWLSGHRGVDLTAPPAAAVRAAGAGTVAHAGLIAGRGVVSVRHAGGLRTTYEPVVVDPALEEGMPVVAGQRLGSLAAGHPGCPRPACLPWGLRRGEQYLDPLALLGLGRVRQLPLYPRQGLSAARRATPGGVRPSGRSRLRCCTPAR